MRYKKPALITAGAVLLFLGVFSSVSGAGRSWWRKVNVNHPGQICGVAMSPSGQHIVFSGDFTAHSSDGGVTWQVVERSPFIMNYGTESHVFGVASGQSGSVGVYRSTDYGVTWLLMQLPDNLINFNEVDFVDSVHGWAVGNKDFIVTTSDGWQTWTTKPFGVPGMIGGGQIPGYATGFCSRMVGRNGFFPFANYQRG